MPFVVGVNRFDGAPRYPIQDVRDALEINPGCPCSTWTPGTGSSCRDALLVLLELLV